MRTITRVAHTHSKVAKKSIHDYAKSTVVITAEAEPLHPEQVNIVSSTLNNDSVVSNIILETAIRAEHLAPEGFRAVATERFYSEELARRAYWSDFELLLNELCCDDTALVDAVRTAIKLAGVTGRIFIEPSPTECDSVEQQLGCVFMTTSPLEIIMNDVQVLCIDGFVESVGEINLLLETTLAADRKCLLFARGYHDDVLNTLCVNHSRGNMSVIPISVAYDLEGANSLADIATVLGIDVISSLKGELISSVQYKMGGRVANARVSKTNVTLSVTDVSRIESHLQRLRVEADSASDIKSEMLKKRVKSLASNRIIIRIRNDSALKRRCLLADKALRSYISLAKQGVTSTGHLARLSRVSKECLDSLARVLDSDYIITS